MELREKRVVQPGDDFSSLSQSLKGPCTFSSSEFRNRLQEFAVVGASWVDDQTLRGGDREFQSSFQKLISSSHRDLQSAANLVGRNPEALHTLLSGLQERLGDVSRQEVQLAKDFTAQLLVEQLNDFVKELSDFLPKEAFSPSTAQPQEKSTDEAPQHSIEPDLKPSLHERVQAARKTLATELNTIYQRVQFGERERGDPSRQVIFEALDAVNESLTENSPTPDALNAFLKHASETRGQKTFGKKFGATVQEVLREHEILFGSIGPEPDPPKQTRSSKAKKESSQATKALEARKSTSKKIEPPALSHGERVAGATTSFDPTGERPERVKDIPEPTRESDTSSISASEPGTSSPTASTDSSEKLIVDELRDLVPLTDSASVLPLSLPITSHDTVVPLTISAERRVTPEVTPQMSDARPEQELQCLPLRRNVARSRWAAIAALIGVAAFSTPITKDSSLPVSDGNRDSHAALADPPSPEPEIAEAREHGRDFVAPETEPQTPQPELKENETELAVTLPAPDKSDLVEGTDSNAPEADQLQRNRRSGLKLLEDRLTHVQERFTEGLVALRERLLRFTSSALRESKERTGTAQPDILESQSGPESERVAHTDSDFNPPHARPVPQVRTEVFPQTELARFSLDDSLQTIADSQPPFQSATERNSLAAFSLVQASEPLIGETTPPTEVGELARFSLDDAQNQDLPPSRSEIAHTNLIHEPARVAVEIPKFSLEEAVRSQSKREASRPLASFALEDAVENTPTVETSEFVAQQAVNPPRLSRPRIVSLTFTDLVPEIGETSPIESNASARSSSVAESSLGEALADQRARLASLYQEQELIALRPTLFTYSVESSIEEHSQIRPPLAQLAFDDALAATTTVAIEDFLKADERARAHYRKQQAEAEEALLAAQLERMRAAGDHVKSDTTAIK